MKIGLIELSTHSEVLQSLIHQVVDLGVTPTVYTNEFCAESCAADSYGPAEWRICPPELSNAEFIERCTPSIIAQDHVFIITPMDALCGLLSRHAVKTPAYHCLIHNLNTFTAANDNLPSAAIFRLVLQGAASAVLPDLRLVKSADPLRERAINIAYPQYPPAVFHRDEVRCCIPGRIYGGRDYAEVLAALEIASPRLTRRLRVDFLGECVDKESKTAVEAARKTVSARVELRDRPNYVVQKEFDKTLAEADFLVLPIPESITRNGITEMRGQTSVTGNVNDMVRFGLPSLMPAFYPLSDHVNGLTGRYSSVASLAGLIVAWVHTGEFNRRKRKSISGLKAYRAECLTALCTEIARADV